MLHVKDFLRAGFMIENVRALIAEDSMGRLSEEAPQGELVSHGSRQDKETCLLASQPGDIPLEPCCDGVLAVDVVPVCAGLDGCQHGLCRDGGDIAFFRYRLLSATMTLPFST